MRNLPDHGLPLVQLKEQRRDLIVALQNRNGPVSGWELMQIAAIQQAISAFEDVSPTSTLKWKPRRKWIVYGSRLQGGGISAPGTLPRAGAFGSRGPSRR
jgi:hypothetical protein